MYVQTIPWEANYDESQMPVYPLPADDGESFILRLFEIAERLIEE